MKFQVGDIIINRDPKYQYDYGLILNVQSDHYITFWFSEWPNSIRKNDDLYAMHGYLLLTDIFRSSLTTYDE